MRSHCLIGKEDVINAPSASVIIPTFNGALRIGHCLDALSQQAAGRNVEIIVVNDGSTDETAAIVERYPRVSLITQVNTGPAAARNRGALEARGAILLFTDDDCVPMMNWIELMLKPFDDRDVVGAKGVYRTRQQRLVARFVQIEYEDRYRLMNALDSIDFIDTYSAAFRRDRFLEMGGYDTSFPVACAEDIELSYRMSRRGWRMKFVPAAIVYHRHPDSLWIYMRKKFKFAFWRISAIRKNPGKAVKDSHTPQLMKFQLLFAPILLLALVFDVVARPVLSLSACVLAAFLVSVLPFTWRALRKDVVVGLFSPLLLVTRSIAQTAGVCGGLIHALCKVDSRASSPLAERNSSH